MLHNREMFRYSLGFALAVFAVPVTAAATPRVQTKVAAVTTRSVVAASLATSAMASDYALSSAVTKGMEHKLGKAKPLLDYKALLDDLVITRDLEVPGAPMVLRLVPVSMAPSGVEDSPIILMPRVVGRSWYGLDVAARF